MPCRSPIPRLSKPRARKYAASWDSKPSRYSTTSLAGPIRWRNTQLVTRSVLRESKSSWPRCPVSIWPGLLTTASEFRIASAWVRKQRRPSFPDINSSLSRRNHDAIHGAGQIERLVDLDVGIKWQQKVLDQKIERCSSHREAANLHAY